MPRPNLLLSVVNNKCPRCRKGKLFVQSNPYHLSQNTAMPEHCPVCHQPYELQTGFYFGTGYVSYALSVGLLIMTAVIWNFTIKFSFLDNSIYYWLATNIALLLAMQPILQRLSRSIWIAIFVRYDEDYAINKPNAVTN